MLPELTPTLIRRRLTSLFPADLVEGIARERDAVQRHRTIDITMLVWSLILGFAVDGETRSIAAFQRAYQTATKPDVEYPEERWATDRKIVAQPVLADLALALGHPPPIV